VVSAEQEHVKSDLRYNLGFVASPKHFNVAVRTRAKTLLIVIGCSLVLAMDQEHWLPFLKYCHENKSWVGEEEWDPSEVEEELEQKEAESLEDDWDWVNALSQIAEQTGFIFISREE
jgi:hypothetical protein